VSQFPKRRVDWDTGSVAVGNNPASTRKASRRRRTPRGRGDLERLSPRARIQRNAGSFRRRMQQIRSFRQRTTAHARGVSAPASTNSVSKPHRRRPARNHDSPRLKGRQNRTCTHSRRMSRPIPATHPETWRIVFALRSIRSPTECLDRLGRGDAKGLFGGRR